MYLPDGGKSAWLSLGLSRSLALGSRMYDLPTATLVSRKVSVGTKTRQCPDETSHCLKQHEYCQIKGNIEKVQGSPY